MVANTIKTATVGWSLALIAAIEAVLWFTARKTSLQPLIIIGTARIVQIIGMLLIICRMEGSGTFFGIDRSSWAAGLKRGALWSAGFAVVAAIGLSVSYLIGINMLPRIRTPLPTARTGLLLFLIVGGLIAPIAEELCFRGILYTYFRRWGILAALIISTTIFVGLHSVPGLPVVQIVGGLVFALAYENSGNLLVPMTIHISGNLAIFALSL